jgi:hypothetical protein
MLSRPSSLQGLSDSRSGRHVAAYTYRFRCSDIHLEAMETARASDSTSHFFLRMPPPLPRVPRECVFPLLPHEHWPSPIPYGLGAYPTYVGLSLRSGSPSNACQSPALRGCSVRLMLRPADSVGATDWVGQRVAALRGYRVGANSARLLPGERALYLFI